MYQMPLASPHKIVSSHQIGVDDRIMGLVAVEAGMVLVGEEGWEASVCGKELVTGWVLVDEIVRGLLMGKEQG